VLIIHFTRIVRLLCVLLAITMLIVLLISQKDYEPFLIG
jgi:hypothetical protein